MANEFDKFDSQANAFDAFDKPVAALPTVTDEELAQFKQLGFNGSKEDIANEMAQHAQDRLQHSTLGQAQRDVVVGALAGPVGLAKVASYISNPVLAYATRNQADPSSLVGQLDQSLATPRNTAQTGGQRIARDVTRGLAGTASTLGLGAGIAGPSSFLAAAPGMQLTSSALGSAASGATRELGGGTKSQIAAGLVASMLPGGAKYAAERIIGEPNAAAQTLQGAGVDNLTAGQQNAGGAYSQIEDASTHLPLIGASFKQAKEQAQAKAKEAFILQGAAPGAQVKPTGDLQETLTKVGDTFKTAYDTVTGFPLVLDKGKPVIVNQGANTPLSTAFARAVSDRSIDATSDTRKQAASWLGNLLTRPIKSSEDLISLRSEIRSRINALAKDQSSEVLARREIYQGAEQQITKALESQLPAPLMQNLKAVDAQYARYKVAVDAMAKGGDRPGGFTWPEASQAAKASAQGALGKDAYAKGAGFMRDIPAAARQAFATAPATGASLTAQSASYPLLPLTAFLSLTNKGRSIAAGNQLNPFNPAPAALSVLLAEPQ